MNVSNDELDRWRRMAMRARNILVRVPIAVKKGDLTGIDNCVGEAYDLAFQLVERLDLAGAKPSHHKPSQHVPLRLLDTEASRAYLMALREARTTAIVMDGERYSPGEAWCCDTPSAGLVDLLVCGMEMEIFGESIPPYAGQGDDPPRLE